MAKKRPRLVFAQRSLFRIFLQDHSALGAPTGHTPAQAPHSMQVSASMTYLPSPSEIAPTGHSAAQAPQAMHSSEILYAMVKYTSLLVCLYCNSFTGKLQALFLKKGKFGRDSDGVSPHHDPRPYTHFSLPALPFPFSPSPLSRARRPRARSRPHLTASRG